MLTDLPTEIFVRNPNIKIRIDDVSITKRIKKATCCLNNCNVTKTVVPSKISYRPIHFPIKLEIIFNRESR